MDLPDILTALKRRWPTAVAALAVGAGAACTQLALAVPTYDATARLYVTVAAADSGSTTDLVQGGNAAQQRVQSYVDIITTPRVLQPAIDELGLDTTAQELSEHVRASSPNETVLLNLTVNDPSPKRAAAIANAVSDSFTRLVADDLEQSSTPETPSPVSVRTVQPALNPVTPATPQPMKSLLLGIGGGLVAGIVLALLRDLLDTRIRGRAEVESATVRPILGTVPRTKDLQKAPVYVQRNRRGPFAEAFRALRTNLRFVEQGGTNRVLMVTSANPTEGKTTTSLNLAAALMEGGSRVAVVDCDLRRPAVADRLGIPNEAGLTDVLIGRAELDEVLHRWGTTGSVLATGAIPPNPADLLDSQGMRAVLAALAADHDYVIVDTPPLLPVTDAAVLARSTAGAIVVTAARQSRTNELRDAIAVLDQAGAQTLGIVVGMVNPRHSRNSYVYRGDGPELSDDDLEPLRRIQTAD